MKPLIGLDIGPLSTGRRHGRADGSGFSKGYAVLCSLHRRNACAAAPVIRFVSFLSGPMQAFPSVDMRPSRLARTDSSKVAGYPILRVPHPETPRLQ